MHLHKYRIITAKDEGNYLHWKSCCYHVLFGKWVYNLWMYWVLWWSIDLAGELTILLKIKTHLVKLANQWSCRESLANYNETQLCCDNYTNLVFIVKIIQFWQLYKISCWWPANWSFQQCILKSSLNSLHTLILTYVHL